MVHSSSHSVIHDPNHYAWTTQDFQMPQWNDAVVYELHVRDFTTADERVPEEHRGRYLGFTHDGYGARHLRSLREAGLTDDQLGFFQFP